MRNEHCRDCALHQAASYVCLWGDGPKHAEIMIVGEAPGAEEDKHGRPFVGAAGKLLDQLLLEAGIGRRSVYITNTVKCHPPANRTPGAAEVGACISYLLEEIQSVQPRVIIALGNVALKALTGRDKILSERGKLLPPRRGLYTDALIMATVHPAAVLRPEGKSYRSLIVNDLTLARTIAESQPDTGHARLVTPSTSVFDGVAYLQSLYLAPVLSVDCEWTGGRESQQMVWPWSRSGELYSVSLSGRMPNGELRSVALAWPMAEEAHREVAKLLRSKPVVFHNAMADMLWLDAEGFEVAIAGDTMLMAYLLDERQRRNLEAVATAYSSEVTPGWKGGIRSTRPETEDEWLALLGYNAEDTRATLLAWEGLLNAVRALPKERREAVMRAHRRLLVAAIPVLVQSARVGVPLNREKLIAEAARSRERYNAAVMDLAELSHTTPMGAAKLAASPQKTQEFLRGPLGLVVFDSTKETLADLIKYPAVEAILRVRKESKLLSTYLDPWLRMVERQGDDALHTVYRLAGTRSGRLSAESEEGGSIQVAPRNTTEVNFRGMVEAHDGYEILAADYSQVELRVISWIANEPVMRQLYLEGADLHSATAAYLLASREGPMAIEEFWPQRMVWIGRVSKLERQDAKPVNFGLCYGMGAEGFRDYARLQYGVHMSLEQAQEMRNGYFRLYSALPAWHNREMRSAERLGYSETPFGRRRSFDPNDVHAAINNPIQSTASDFGLLAMVAAHRRYRREGLDARIFGSIHDSILVLVRSDQAEAAGQILKWEMENVDTSDFGFRIPVPLIADLKVGKSWG